MKKDLFVLASLSKRNIKLYYKDHITFMMSLLTPLILLVLFILFLKNVYVSSLEGIMKDFEIVIAPKLSSAFANHWLISSILSTSSVTIAFCSSIIMSNDYIDGTIKDLEVSPIKPGVRGLAYLIATFFSTFIVLLVMIGISFVFLAFSGFYMKVSNILLTLAGLGLNCLFGSTLACIIARYVKTQGGVSAVATLVSSMYGFLCGAYMPINQFPKAIQNFVLFIPGTYGSNIFRRSVLSDNLNAIIDSTGMNEAGAKAIRDGFDINMYFFGHQVTMAENFLILGVSCLVLIVIYVLLNFVKFKKKARN